MSNLYINNTQKKRIMEGKTIMITIENKKIKNYQELIETVIENIEIDDLADEYTSTVQRTIDKDWIHDRYCDELNDKDYEEFKKILYDNDEDYETDLDIGDSMYHMSGGGFSSWSDYYSYRFG